MARERMEPYEERGRYPEEEERWRRREHPPSDWDRAARQMDRYGDRERPWAREDWRRNVQGPFVGVGPKGYRRSDDRIREEINDRLMAHGGVDATDIEVEVRNGEVNLTGIVNSRAQKRTAEDTAESVSGVRDVHNMLRVQEQGGGFIGGPEAWGETGRWHGGSR